MSNHADKNGHVHSETHRGVTRIGFGHPQSNSLPASVLQQLAKAIRHAGDDPDTVVIVLHSSGEKAFCAGASFDELVAIQNEAEGLAFFSGFAEVINAMRICPKFIIARIQGKCVGGGVGVAAAADYALAVKGSDVKLSELAVGIGPFVVGPAVERKIGTSAFTQLAIDATRFRTAEWAKHKGLFAEVYDSTEELDEAIGHLTHTLSHSSPEAMAEMKKIFWKGTENWDVLLKERAAVSGRLVLSDFTREAIAAFKKK